jgi:hypothetical protein
MKQHSRHLIYFVKSDFRTEVSKKLITFSTNYSKFILSSNDLQIYSSEALIGKEYQGLISVEKIPIIHQYIYPLMNYIAN